MLTLVMVGAIARSEVLPQPATDKSSWELIKGVTISGFRVIHDARLGGRSDNYKGMSMTCQLAPSAVVPPGTVADEKFRPQTYPIAAQHKALIDATLRGLEKCLGKAPDRLVRQGLLDPTTDASWKVMRGNTTPAEISIQVRLWNRGSPEYTTSEHPRDYATGEIFVARKGKAAE